MNDYEALIAEAREAFAKAHTELIRILSIDERVRMSIPANKDRDTDLIVVAALDAGRSVADALEEVTRPDWLKDTQPEQGGIPGLTEAEATAFQARDWDEVRRLQDAPPVEGVREVLIKFLHKQGLFSILHEPIRTKLLEDWADALSTEFTITPKEVDQ